VNVVVIGDSHAYHTFAGVNIPGVTITSVVLPITLCSVLRDRPTFIEPLQRADVAIHLFDILCETRCGA